MGQGNASAVLLGVDSSGGIEHPVLCINENHIAILADRFYNQAKGDPRGANHLVAEQGATSEAKVENAFTRWLSDFAKAQSLDVLAQQEQQRRRGFDAAAGLLSGEVDS